MTTRAGPDRRWGARGGQQLPPPPPASEWTPEPLYRDRRALLGGALALLAGGATGVRAAPGADGSGPAGDAVTPVDSFRGYANFYELGTDKADPLRRAEAMAALLARRDPWQIEVGGLCERPGLMALDAWLKPAAQEERVYRLRCVEGWSMVIPWQGVPLAALIEAARPRPEARYVAFETVFDRKQPLPGQRRAILPWPYVEGLRLDEARHPLTLIATGAYGQPLAPGNGAPVRLVVPWKYGFKSIKSIVAMRFTAEEPPATWNVVAPNEYGFYANVNPSVDHPRWSQASERRIGELRKRPTLPFNGYAEQVAGLYSGMDLRRFY